MKIYPLFEEAFFVDRLNRFVMRLERKSNNGKSELIDAYVANPGRMEEFQVPGHPFFITTGNQGKYYYRVVATSYQNSFILLDTIKMNALVELMLKNDRIDVFKNVKSFRREVTVNRSKFDFLIESETGNQALMEVKSCSLCHHGVAMFPDAPTARGKRHLEDLQTLAENGNFDCYTLYLINHKDATVFMPNWHTDFEYARQFMLSDRIHFMAYAINLIDPVTIDTDVLRPVAIEFEKTEENSRDIGSYLLVFYNDSLFSQKIGSLGERKFKPGYYVYVGSAMQGLERRIKRHLSKKKSIHWHLDYISPEKLKIDKIYKINRKDRIEEKLALKMAEISPESVAGFGASDTQASSHLFYYPDRPYRRREFLDLLLDARMLILE